MYETSISDEEKDFILKASHYLENPSFLTKITQMMGNPLEKTLALLPKKTQRIASEASEKALKAALKFALQSLNTKNQPDHFPHDFKDSLEKSALSRVIHSIATGITGAAGGLFGLIALPVELPLTTTLILRSVAKIATDFGADLTDRKTQMECLFIFAMGSPSKEGTLNGSHYYSARLTFSTMAKEALAFLSVKTAQEVTEILARESAPILAQILTQIANRFQIVVSQKFAAQTLPVTGAVAGSVINILFTEHFNTIAKYHFGLQKLEHKYGEDAVRAAYLKKA